MSINSYLIAIFAGVLVYLVMMIDNKYIEPTDRQVSPKVPLFVTLLVWFICIFSNSDNTAIPISKQPVMTGGFYK